jgi:RNA recognition motif-containing protein
VGAEALRDPPSDPNGSLEGWLSISRAENRIENSMGNRLYVGNLSFNATSDGVREAFSACGEVTDVHIVQDRDSGQSRGFGFVTMSSEAEAASAISQLDGTSLDGRSLRVNEAEERQNRGGGGGGRSGGGGGGRW